MTPSEPSSAATNSVCWCWTTTSLGLCASHDARLGCRWSGDVNHRLNVSAPDQRQRIATVHGWVIVQRCCVYLLSFYILSEFVSLYESVCSLTIHDERNNRTASGWWLTGSIFRGRLEGRGGKLCTFHCSALSQLQLVWRSCCKCKVSKYMFQTYMKNTCMLNKIKLRWHFRYENISKILSQSHKYNVRPNAFMNSL